MDRRSVLKTVTILVGGAMSAGTVASIMSGCQPSTSDDWKPFILDKNQINTLAEVVETILPATDTPGAKELMVHRFIDEAIAKNYGKEEQTKIIGSITAINDECKKMHKKSFIEASADERLSTVEAVDKASYAMMSKLKNPWFVGYSDTHPFYELKSLVLGGYFSTEIGQTKVLQHAAIPGKYEACIPLSEAGNGKTWAQ